jgi:hypothetical protein
VTGKRLAKRGSMKKLGIRFDDIQKAMEDVVRDAFDYYLDLSTGDVITISEEVFNEVNSRLYEGENDDIEDDVECIEFEHEPDVPFWMEDEMEVAMDVLFDEQGRYARIPERSSIEAHRIMSDFVSTVQEPELKKMLLSALDGKGAFRRFKDSLLNYPQERKRWHGFNARSMQHLISGWLKSVGVDADKEVQT